MAADRGSMPAIAMLAMGALVAGALIVIVLGEARAEVIRPIIANSTNTSSTTTAAGYEKDAWPVAATGGTLLLVAYGIIINALRTGGPP